MKRHLYGNTAVCVNERIIEDFKFTQLKYALFFIFLLLTVGQAYSQTCSYCNFYITLDDVTDSNAKIIEWDAGPVTATSPNAKNVQPGQTICFKAINYMYTIRIKNVVGTAANPIKIRNCGGQAFIDNKNNGTTNNGYHALDISGSKHFILAGDGDANIRYGIKVSSNGHGISLAGYSTDFEVQRIEISYADGSGINSKTDPDCVNTDVSWFVQRNSFFHDNYIHHVVEEGFYIGYTHYPINEDYYKCPEKTLKAHGMVNVKIYNNQLDYIGRDAIQVGAMISGGEIYNNTIQEYGTRNDGAHIHGIQLSDKNDGCAVYNNRILPIGEGLAGPGCGIASWADKAKIYNNLLVRTGRDILDPGNINDKGFTAIQIYDGPDLTNAFQVLNNTIIEPGRAGISVFSEETGIRIDNNLIIQAQGRYITAAPSSATQASNFKSTSTAGLGFTADYHLSEDSPATIVGAGVNLYSIGVTTDFDNQARPSSGPFDIGADEYEVIDPPPTGGRTVKINFRGTDPAPLEAEWNDWNVLPTTLSPAPTLTNIRYTDGATTTYTATLTARFSGANGLGVSGSGAYPSQVMQTNWYIHNISSTPGAVTLSGLDNTKKYSFKFFGSRKDVNGTIDRTTEYAIGGTTVTLNASNNANLTADINDISPVNGNITFTVKYGPGIEFGYLNALEMTESSVVVTKNIKVNVRGTTPAPVTPGWNDWNAAPTTTNPAPTFTNLKYSDGTSSNYNLVITTAFSGANGAGMNDAGGVYPPEIMQTNWYVHNNTTNPGVFRVTGLDNSKLYSFRFFGSREDLGGTINRSTNYTIGSTTVTLNASNNTSERVDINDVSPSNGIIVVTVKYGTDAEFGYLNAFEIFEKPGGTSAMAMTAEEVEDPAMENAGGMITAHPVPFNNTVALTFPQKIEGRVSIVVTDIHGRKFFHENDYEISDGTVVNIDLSASGARKGLHVIRIQSTDGYKKTIHVLRE
jgi:hypothetical protein